MAKKKTTRKRTNFFANLSLFFVKNKAFTAVFMSAIVLFGAVFWTVRTTKEYPPVNVEAFNKMKAEN